jgi:NAD-dependent SIR2 family protein deacetylase
MSGGIIGTASCYACHELFTFNPERVPSFDGHPICEACMTIVNRERVEHGKPPHAILPGAYEVTET